MLCYKAVYGLHTHTHLDLLLDVSEGVCGAHVSVFLDGNHIQFHLHVLNFLVCAHHLMDLFGGDHDHFWKQSSQKIRLRPKAIAATMSRELCSAP